ncbi:COX15/CtaA family protein [uncultured Ferrimonas sp.]|uniref:COX15/CtaA family protein n=1 Tax=uncultured Ferrimonas sp. TaxID=432640 RepID=UPI00260CDB0B|nr:COX15/CtaA family protein [uncultured Ferrimonas sp.]
MKGLTLFSLCFALVVILLGAFTRLTDAGLGCPDWPGCYGYLTVPNAEQAADAQARFPERAIEPAKAWAEMVHRYVAACLGLLILAIAVLHWRQRGASAVPYLLLGLVVFQAALGMWTVTLNLMPLVVMGHLLGGFSIAALLLYWLLQQRGQSIQASERDIGSATHVTKSPRGITSGLKAMAATALVVLVTQIALGGWTSANYASLACTQLPICEGDWLAKLNPTDAFSPLQAPASSYEYGVLDHPARLTIHVSHRIWALVTTAILLLLWWRLRQVGIQREANVMAVVLTLQIALGIGNVLGGLPLAVAVAHNGVALLLLLAVIASNVRLWQGEAQHG